MLSSGITLDEDGLAYFQNLKENKKYKGIVYKIEAGNIVAERTSDERDFNAFVEPIIELEEPRFAVYDLEYEVNGQMLNKILLVKWIPDNSDKYPQKTERMRQNVKYASSWQYLCSTLTGIITREISDPDELLKIKQDVFKYHN